MFNFDLSQEIESFVLTHIQCKEYEIIQHLQTIGRLEKDCLRDSTGLFRTHFLIFNALYRLQLAAFVHQKYQLSISSLAIITTPYSEQNPENEKRLQQHDPLALFYLDTSHLFNTSEADIEHLLNHFWQHYFNAPKKQTALATLGLSEPVDFKTIKLQYRRLAMQHHPDRGGDADTLIQIHQAMQCLQQYYA